jgi:hypothetical protein
MAKDIGILLDRDGELLVQNGSVAVGDITGQNQNFILLAAEGEFKESPTKGVGIYNFLEDDSPENLVRKIQSQFFSEGLKIGRLRVQMPAKIDIDAQYRNN